MRILGRIIGRRITLYLRSEKPMAGAGILAAMQNGGIDMSFLPDGGLTESDLIAVYVINMDASASDGNDEEKAVRFLCTLKAYLVVVQYMNRMRDLCLAIGTFFLVSALLFLSVCTE